MLPETGFVLGTYEKPTNMYGADVVIQKINDYT